MYLSHHLRVCRPLHTVATAPLNAIAADQMMKRATHVAFPKTERRIILLHLYDDLWDRVDSPADLETCQE